MTLSTEAVRPANLKFRVNAEYLKSAVNLGFIENVSPVDALTDEFLCRYLERKAE